VVRAKNDRSGRIQALDQSLQFNKHAPIILPRENLALLTMKLVINNILKP
jgi:hypothetical protein